MSFGLLSEVGGGEEDDLSLSDDGDAVGDGLVPYIAAP